MPVRAYERSCTTLEKAAAASELSHGKIFACPKVIILKPKRPRTAYNIFFQAEQRKIKNMKKTGKGRVAENTAKLVSISWEALPSSKKTEYFQLAAEDKFRYYHEKDEYARYIDQINMESNNDDQSNYPDCGEIQLHDEDAMPENWRIQDNVNNYSSVGPYSHESIALLASKLDAESIDFLIKALK